MEAESKKAKKTTQQQIDELFAIFNAVEGLVYVADMETYEILAVNKYGEEHYGPGLVGKVCYEQLHRGQTTPCSFCTNHLLVGSDGVPKSSVVWQHQNNKTGNWYHCTDRAIYWPDGRIVRMEIAVNITGRKLAEEMLEKNTQRLAKRVKELDCLYDISRIVEKQGISSDQIFQGIVDLIPSAWQYPEIGCARIIIEGHEFKTRRFKETIWRQSSDIIVHGEPCGTVEVYYLAERPEIDEGPFQKEERNLINAIARRLGRITEHVRAEESLRKSEKDFRDLVENSLVGILIIQDDRVVYGNPEQERLFGPVRRSLRFSQSVEIHPDDLGRVRELYHRVISGEGQAGGTEFRFCPPGTTYNARHTKWVHARASLIEYRGKKAMLANVMDITRVKELEHLLRIQDKMTSLGHVAAGIAHEIRNPLSGINIYLSTLEKLCNNVEGLEKVKEILWHMKSASSKIESVIRRVMDFSKPGQPNFVLTDLNEPIEEAINLASVTLRKSGIKIEKVLYKDLPLCQADAHLIEEVILNLINNAAEAMKNIDGDKKMEITSSLEKRYIVVKVSDSGHGVPPDLRDQIFDPFYTTKNGNTGIGLSISKRIVTDHGGFLDVFQGKLDGAEFVVGIPIEKRKKFR